MTYCNTAEATILKILRNGHVGEYQAISAQEIAALLRINVRAARSLVAHLRGDHQAPICSTPAAGFYWPRNSEDVDRAIAQLESRVTELRRAVAGLRDGREELFGQPSLFESP